MKKLFGREAFSLLPVAGGLIVTERMEKENNRDQYFYHLFPTDTFKMTTLSRSQFLLYKFGVASQHIVEKLDEVNNCKTVILPDGRVLVVFKSGDAGLFNVRGQMIRQFMLTYMECGPSDIMLFEDFILASFERVNALVRFTTTTIGSEMRFGSLEPPSFPAPVSLAADETERLVYITSAETNKVVTFHLDTHAIEHYAEFSEPIRQYVRIGAHEIFLVESGVYRV